MQDTMTLHISELQEDLPSHQYTHSKARKTFLIALSFLLCFAALVTMQFKIQVLCVTVKKRVLVSNVASAHRTREKRTHFGSYVATNMWRFLSKSIID